MLTAAQIVLTACTIAKCPGYLVQAGQRLNEVLLDLAFDQNLDIIRRTTTINITGGTQQYALPTTFLRPREVFYNIEGAVFTLTQYALSDFDALFTGPGLASYPELYNIMIETNTIQFYPMPLMPIAVTVRYMDSSVEITSPETSSIIPWFPKQSTLIEKLAEKMMQITDDTRVGYFKTLGDDALRGYLQMDNGSTLKTVKMDPRTFHKGGGNLKPTKAMW